MKREDLIAYRIQLQRKLDAVDVLLEGDEEQRESKEMVIQRTGQLTRENLSPERKWQGESLPETGTTLIQAINDFVASADKPFTKTDLVRSIQAKHPKLQFSPRSVSNPLIKMVGDGLVDVVREGSGKVPNIYRSKSPNKEAAA